MCQNANKRNNGGVSNIAPNVHLFFGSAADTVVHRLPLKVSLLVGTARVGQVHRCREPQLFLLRHRVRDKRARRSTVGEESAKMPSLGGLECSTQSTLSPWEVLKRATSIHRVLFKLPAVERGATGLRSLSLEMELCVGRTYPIGQTLRGSEMLTSQNQNITLWGIFPVKTNPPPGRNPNGGCLSFPPPGGKTPPK